MLLFQFITGKGHYRKRKGNFFFHIKYFLVLLFSFVRLTHYLLVSEKRKMFSSPVCNSADFKDFFQFSVGDFLKVMLFGVYLTSKNFLMLFAETSPSFPVIT